MGGLSEHFGVFVSKFTLKAEINRDFQKRKYPIVSLFLTVADKMTKTAPPTPTYSVGDPVVLQGTGKHWKGLNYSAVVVEVRTSDNTIKVRYSDGGYKRFSMADFNEQVLQGDKSPYKLESYELDEDHYDPTAEAVEIVGSLRTKLNNAILAKNFIEAHEIKLEIQKIVQKAEKLKELRSRLSAAVNNHQFLEADKYQKEINELTKVEPPKVSTVDTTAVMWKALSRAAGGGLAGSAAMSIQVLSLMWMRTTMNYQYKYGTSTREAFKRLYADGGIRRFYRGVVPALLQGPLSRFGDTAANTGVLMFLNEHPKTQNLPVFVKTLSASAVAASFRILLMPVDTIKTTLQVDGKAGWSNLMAKTKLSGPTVFFHGALASSAATFVGHFPWFFTYNYLDSNLPKQTEKAKKLMRNAFMGFTSSVVSDTISNSIRVVKTYRQTSQVTISYVDTVKSIVKEDGLSGLFGRGLGTRIMTNGAQGLMFSVLWKYFDEKWKK
jgi:hypothetical protein